MTNPNIQQGFYQGQKVIPEDLNKLQAYADKGTSGLASDILGYGVVVQGFELSKLKDFTLAVTAGSAFNQIGERLILSSGTTVDLTTTGQNVVKIGIKKKHIGSGTVVDILGKDVHTILTPSVEFITGKNLEAGTFELAEVKLDAYGIKTITKTAPELITIHQQKETTNALSTELDQLADTVTENKSELNGQISVLSDTVTANNSNITDHMDNINSMLSKDDGWAVLQGKGFEIKSTDPTRGFYIGNKYLSLANNNYTGAGGSNHLNLITEDYRGDLYIDGTGFYLNKNWNTGEAHPFWMGGSGKFTLSTDKDLEGNNTNIDLIPSSGIVNINGTPIIESGSIGESMHNRGNYIKFYDGTMICYIRYQHNLDENNDIRWVFPANFSTTPLLTGLYYDTADGSWCTRFQNVSITNSRFYCYLNEGRQPYRNTRISFIGRWK